MFIDKIIVINLLKAEDRKIKLIQNLNKIGVNENDVLFLPAFDGTHRSDIAQEYTYLCYENNITVKFIKLVSSKNSKWKLGRDRFFGNGCFYEFKDSAIYHQFQTNLEEQKQDFKLECEKIINNG
jgi:hypothetical protein